MTIASRMHNARALLEVTLFNDTRDWFWMLIKAQDALKASLQAVVDDGLIAADRLTDTPQP